MSGISLAELLNTAQDLAGISSANSKPELEIIMNSGNKTPGVTAQQFINAYRILSQNSTKSPIEFIVDQIHSNVKYDKTSGSNNTRISNIYALKDNEPGYKRIKMVYIVKKRFQPHEGNGFKVVLSSEESFDPTTVKSNDRAGGSDYARIKVRTTFTKWVKSPDWKIDVTAVWGMPWPNQTNHLKNIIEKCFNSWKNVSNEITQENLNKFNTFEVEAEYVGDYKVLTESKIQELIGELNSILYNKQVDESTELLYKEVANIAKLIHHYRITNNMTVKKVSAMPIELNRNTWKEVFPPLGWYVTDKADGKRSLIHLIGRQVIILSATAKKIELDIDPQPRTIVDCEEVAGKYYVFDVLFFKDNQSYNTSFQRRYLELEPAAKYLADITKLDISAKPFNRLPLILSNKPDEELRKPIEEIWNRERPYEVDGLIFNSPDAKYLDTKMYKWKPHNTIDFLAVKCPNLLLGQAPYFNKPGHTLYLLFVTLKYEEYINIGMNIMDGYEKVFPQYGIRHGSTLKVVPPGGQQSLFPIQFSPSFYPRAYIYYAANGVLPDSDQPRIVELYVDPAEKNVSKIIENGEPLPWKLIGIREDRQTDVLAGGYFGNYLSIAESVAQNIINPFPLESLWSSANVYFQEEKDPIYFAPMAFNSFVKSKLFTELRPENLQKTKTHNILLDLAAGRGADIGRYKNGEFTQVVAIDNDIDALSELSRRKYSKNFTNLPNIYTLQANFNEDDIYKKLESIGMPTSYDAISCNFAIHYVSKIEDFAKTIKSLLKPGGQFGFTCFDGKRINKLLEKKDIGDSWIGLAENNFVKYQIQKMYSGNILGTNNQIINVKLPFSDQLYAENLVNIDNLITIFAKKGLKLKLRRPFADFLDNFAEENEKVYGRLTKEDKEFISLYELVIFT